MVKDVRTWTTLIYLMVMLPLGVLYFTTAVTGLAVGVAFILVPVVSLSQRFGWSWVPGEPETMIWFNPAWLDTPAGWVFSVVLGVVILTALLHAARGVVSVHARTAKTLLVAQGA